MTKTTTIINHLTGMNSDTIAIVGTTGQVQLIKHETNMEDINEFYDTEEAANLMKAGWDD
tara:strand:- start:3201 stop:3380 length:180 start_codon:yes stop_codon:yes gene_type:complete